MTHPLIIAIPSKGRLQDQTQAFFGRAGLKVVRPGGARNYRGGIAGFDSIEIAFLSASEIARELASGSVHLGITGLDLVHETIADFERRVHLVAPLGFGHADVVAAVPKAWIDVRTMTDIGDIATDFRGRHGQRLRVATKYVHVTRGFFARAGVSEYQIVESLGATEGAPAAGSADMIVDITSTGSTLEANNLKVLDDGIILKSQAHLVASLAAPWGETARAALSDLLDRVQAEELARTTREIRLATSDGGRIAEHCADMWHCTAPFGPSASNGAPVLTLHCPVEHVQACVAWLRRQGAATVTVASLDYVFVDSNPMYRKIADRLETAAR